MEKFETKIGDANLSIETGKLAKFASGSVTIRLGDTVLLVTSVIADKPKDGATYFPLLIDFEEKMYASGKISGSRFIKREGRASDNAILTARLTDRPLRPLFPKGFYNDVQVVVTVLSADLIYDPDTLSIIGASASLTLAGAPFSGPIGAVRVGYIDDKFVINPSYEQLASESKLDLIVAGTKDKVLMIEAGMNELDEAKLSEAIEFAHKSLQPSISIQEEMVKKMKIAKKEYPLLSPTDEMVNEITSKIGGDLEKAVYDSDKTERNTAMNDLKDSILEEYVNEDTPTIVVEDAFGKIVKKIFRENILKSSKRPDGRKLDEIRDLSCEVATLPRTHGSAIFNRGETQALTIATLGSVGDEQMIDTMDQSTTKRYLHHYNFPPYSVGEVRPMRGPGRRDIGHGALAEKALIPVVPSREEFPYTIRLVSEILGSNGSSSMAAVCGSTLSLMDAGVPISNPVVGIAMGVVNDEKGGFKVLTDIAGMEDFNGDMDFKIAGTKNGVTALQLDMKVIGMDMKVLQDAIDQSKKARKQILDLITKCISEPRKDVSKFAPQVEIVTIDPEKIKDVIGSGGKVINGMIDRAGGRDVTEINIEDDGAIYVSSSKPEYVTQIVKEIKNLTREAKVGEIYDGKVTRIMDFGAFVEIFPGTEGLVHISQLDNKRVGKVTDIVKEGDAVTVKVVEIDSQGRVNLSRKAMLGGRQDKK
ncbi:MAG: polyribonucleotide nucleotidyltransferase [Patescibacteria group bacterium]|nr:polyribonucleotide nucleotidyltransferase [Patescibacteria group bacterium]